jgi:hypothetical protein
VLFALAVAPASAHAQRAYATVAQQAGPWVAPGPAADPATTDDPGPADAVGGWFDPGARSDGQDPADTGGPGALPDWFAPEHLQDELTGVTSTFVAGTVARLRTDGRAAIPRGVPTRARLLVAQMNRIVGKRYKWGGGHAKLADNGYDCSGAVSYGLIKTGLLSHSMVSGRLARWGEAGGGRWLTIYANKRHVYMEVAGLRLDTSAFGDDPARTGVRWRPVIGRRDGFTIRHVAGL